MISHMATAKHPLLPEGVALTRVNNSHLVDTKHSHDILTTIHNDNFADNCTYIFGRNCDVIPDGPNCDTGWVKLYEEGKAEAKRSHDLSEGSQLARDVLLKRRNEITKTGDHIHKMASIGGYIFGTTTLNVCTNAIHFTNNKVIEFHHNYIDMALEAIENCNKPEFTLEQKRENYGVLIHTAGTIRKWEKTQKLGGMAIGLVASHVNELLAFGMEAKEFLYDEVIMDACLKKEPKKKTSETLMEAIIEMGDGLGLHNAKDKEFLQAPAPETGVKGFLSRTMGFSL
jgi:hypothetical protein